VIAAVGHESDTTIADFVADHRAPTPSAAAEMVAAHEGQICAALERLGRQLVRLTRFKVVDARSRVQEQVLSHAFDEVKARMRNARLATTSANHRLENSMVQSLRHAESRTNAIALKLSPSELQRRMSTVKSQFEAVSFAFTNAIDDRVQMGRERLAIAAASLDALSPLAVLQRGYAVAQDAEGKLIRDAATVDVGQTVKVRVNKGNLHTRVERVEE